MTAISGHMSNYTYTLNRSVNRPSLKDRLSIAAARLPSLARKADAIGDWLVVGGGEVRWNKQKDVYETNRGSS